MKMGQVVNLLLLVISRILSPHPARSEALAQTLALV